MLSICGVSCCARFRKLEYSGADGRSDRCWPGACNRMPSIHAAKLHMINELRNTLDTRHYTRWAVLRFNSIRATKRGVTANEQTSVGLYMVFRQLVAWRTEHTNIIHRAIRRENDNFFSATDRAETDVVFCCQVFRGLIHADMYYIYICAPQAFVVCQIRSAQTTLGF